MDLKCSSKETVQVFESWVTPTAVVKESTDQNRYSNFKNTQGTVTKSSIPMNTVAPTKGSSFNGQMHERQERSKEINLQQMLENKMK